MCFNPFTKILFQPESIHNYITRIIYDVGFTASIVALIIALFIFLYFRYGFLFNASSATVRNIRLHVDVLSMTASLLEHHMDPWHHKTFSFFLRDNAMIG